MTISTETTPLSTQIIGINIPQETSRKLHTEWDVVTKRLQYRDALTKDTRLSVRERQVLLNLLHIEMPEQLINSFYEEMLHIKSTGNEGILTQEIHALEHIFHLMLIIDSR